MSEYEKALKIDELDGMSDFALFNMLDDEIKERLQKRFINELDEADLHSAVFAFAGRSHSEQEQHHREYFTAAWMAFLEREDLRLRYSSQLEDRALNAA